MKELPFKKLIETLKIWPEMAEDSQSLEFPAEVVSGLIALTYIEEQK